MPAALWFCMVLSLKRVILIWDANKLERQGYAVSYCEDGTRKILYSENIEIFENWIEDTVEIIGGVPVVSIDGLIKMKKKLGRQKDLEDIALIEKIRKNGDI